MRMELRAQFTLLPPPSTLSQVAHTARHAWRQSSQCYFLHVHGRGRARAGRLHAFTNDKTGLLGEGFNLERLTIRCDLIAAFRGRAVLVGV